MNDRAYAVPLHERLARVPQHARLVIESEDGMETSFIPVGAMCHEAAQVLRDYSEQPGKWDERIDMMIDFGLRTSVFLGLLGIGMLIGRGLE